jgi:CheY-like chemotaxis protein
MILHHDPTHAQARGKALVVEDSPTDRMKLCLLLDQAGCSYDVAENGREGVAAALSGTYDFVFMDVLMPEMDGCAATRFIHESLGPRSPFIVAVSTLRAESDRRRCAEAGMDYFLNKPVRRAALQSLLED